ncbi:MAG: DUF4397 domain-containing protein [Sphingobacteriaceae bacterium]|nr:MAG: DUF4397 domain-containing protein [Sphingobacteriaceae bacterium]
MKLFGQTNRIKILSLTAILFTTVAFTSCSKDDDEDVDAMARVKVVNAVNGSSNVNLYLDDVSLDGSAVAYGESSGYLATKEGDRNVKFKTGNEVKTDFDVTLKAGKYYTLYYTGTTNSSSNFVTEDDMTPPPSGKARVRFVHASSAASNIDVAVLNATSKLVTDLSYKAASAYETVDANTSFVLTATGSASAGLTMPTEIQAGKIYTIYISGSSNATLSYHVIAQN